MTFPISGVEVSPVVPLLVGFAIATLTTPAGVSGAFLLLPFQFSILGFTAPGVTPTNLLYNVISTPGGIFRHRQQGAIDRPLVLAILRGTIPAVIVGSVLRITVFESPGNFKVLVGFVLGALGVNLILQAVAGRKDEPSPQREVPGVWITVLGAGAGVIGGVYGVSGGSIIAPVLAGVCGLSVRRVAPAALAATFITSIAGVVSFEILDLLATDADPTRRPDWLLAVLFGLGGAVGGYVGARLNAILPEVRLRTLLGLIALGVAISYVEPLF